MRNFLNDQHIVGCLGVWREGEIMKYAIDNLLFLCDEVAILMDYPDENTLQIIEEYKKVNGDRIWTENSTVPPLRDPTHLKRRYKVFQSRIVEQKLAIVKRIHAQRPIDILLAMDSDERYTDEMPQILQEFWKRPETSICMKSIDVYDRPEIIHNKGMLSHWRAYKFHPGVNFTPWRYRDFFQTYRHNDTWKIKGGFVHLSQLKILQSLRDKLRNPSLLEAHPHARLWKLEKPAWELTSKEYEKVLASPHTWLLEDYEKLSS